MVRFQKGDEQVYLLVNRSQDPISVSAQGHRANGKSKLIKLLDPSTGEISKLSLPATLSLGATRSLMLIPEQEYIARNLLNN